MRARRCGAYTDPMRYAAAGIVLVACAGCLPRPEDCTGAACLPSDSGVDAGNLIEPDAAMQEDALPFIEDARTLPDAAPLPDATPGIDAVPVPSEWTAVWVEQPENTSG